MHTTLTYTHILAAYLSITLFVARGALTFAGSGWARHAALRTVPSIVDTVLLGTAVALLFVIQEYPFVDQWLTVKVLGLVVYIVLGALALGSSATRARRTRVTAFLAAVAVFAYLFGVGYTHSPLLTTALG
ncbi:SirB2 family protein [Halorhodospira neutriphila]|uniref:Regulator SirB n=1 Tax=Halorhodospira neutriphila TaxID=168379 RepID=A0ABS1E3H0_9GAMM|nr:SirB2 family protein [Halorhodospira neutriphila]MBK1725518.1 hypothetical protein [Halorhodospira neutriphila]